MFGSRRPFGLGLVRPSPIRKHTPFEEWEQLSARKPNSPGIALSVLLHAVIILLVIFFPTRKDDDRSSPAQDRPQEHRQDTEAGLHHGAAAPVSGVGPGRSAGAGRLLARIGSAPP